MNVLFVIPSLATGGAQSFLAKLVTQFPQASNKIYLWEMHPEKRNDSIYDAISDKAGIITPFYASVINRLSKRNLHFALRILSKADRLFNLEYKLNKWQLVRFIEKKKVDIVSSHMYVADSYCCKLLHQHSVSLVITFHGCYNLILKKIKERQTDPAYSTFFLNDIQQIFQRVNGIIYLTDRQMEFPSGISLNGIPKQKIYNGFLPVRKMESNGNLNSEMNEIHFGMVARGDESKGWGILVKAFLLLREKRPDKKMKLTLVGGSEYLSELEETVTESSISFTGEVNDPFVYIEQFDVGLLPTYFSAESLPNSIIEYLYAGKPVVASGVAEIPEMIKTEQGELAGILVPLNEEGKPDINKLANALEQYILFPELRKKHAALAAEAYRKFDMEICVDKYISFFAEIVKKN